MYNEIENMIMKIISKFCQSKGIFYTLFLSITFGLYAGTACSDKEEELSYAIAVPENDTLRTIKLISYNIYYGLRLDPSTEKTTFIDWISKHDPDIVAIQEANGFTGSSLATMADSYGHSYSVLLRETGFPVALTSRYPITNIKRVFTSSSQGYIFANILDYNIIVLHLNASSEELRQAEMETILSNTIDTYPFRKKWLIMGDFNCVSPLDADALENASGVKNYAIQSRLLDYYKMIDVIKLRHQEFVSTCRTKKFLEDMGDPNWITRYDFVYTSQDLKNNIVNSQVIKDVYTDTISDHYPILLELDNQ